MRFEQIKFAESMPQDVWLDAYIADPLPGYVRPAVLILPGGGYVFVCAEREGEPIAHGFLARGYNAFVLHYSVAKTRIHPAQLQQASLALAFIRAHADTFGIDPLRVFTVGFSAGGHLAGMLATMWHRPEAWRDIGLRFGENCPTGAALIYPVVLGDSPFAHHDSFRNLLGADAPSEASLQSVSLEKQADEHAVPLFLFHTSDDATVDVRNSLLLAAVYRALNKPFELHVLPHGRHGLATGDEITNGGSIEGFDERSKAWIDEAAYWMKTLKTDEQ